MADASGRQFGTDVLLYVASAAPTTAGDEADAAYKPVGLLTDNPFSSTRDVKRAADKEQSGFTGAQLGTGSYNVQCTAHRNVVPDAGQKILRDAHISGDSVYWLISDGVTGNDCVYGTGVVSSYSETNPNDDYTTCQATIEGDGAPTFAAIA